MKSKLLIIDDELPVVEIFQGVLEELFEEISFSQNIENAIDKLKSESFSLIILDININGKNGAEVLRFLIDNPSNENNKTPFIIASGAINLSFVERNYNRFSGILMKPFTHDELFNMVENILQKNSDQPPAPLMGASNDEIHYIPCSMPFPVPQLEHMVNKVLDIVKKTPQLKKLFGKLKIDRSMNSYDQVRIGLLINLSTGISMKLEWVTDKTLEKFVYASYLHNMALTHKPELAKISTFNELDQCKTNMSEMDYELVFEHPNIAADTLAEYKDIPNDVVVMIRQHHELPKEDGFPSKISHHKITPLSAVFIVAHDLTDYIMNDPDWKLEEYVEKSRDKFKGSHFNKIITALSEM